MCKHSFSSERWGSDSKNLFFRTNISKLSPVTADMKTQQGGALGARIFNVPTERPGKEEGRPGEPINAVRPQRKETCTMARNQFRVYYGPQDDEACATLTEVKTRKETVTVQLGEILPLLTEAVRSKRTWLRDFEHDKVTIPTDLHEVILAYQHFSRPSA